MFFQMAVVQLERNFICFIDYTIYFFNSSLRASLWRNQNGVSDNWRQMVAFQMNFECTMHVSGKCIFTGCSVMKHL